jgi:hypothetical protein
MINRDNRGVIKEYGRGNGISRPDYFKRRTERENGEISTLSIQKTRGISNHGKTEPKTGHTAIIQSNTRRKTANLRKNAAR